MIKNNKQVLEKIANDVRLKIINMIYNAGSGHPGGSLSCADILTVVYKYGMDNKSDKFVMSKGHGAPAYYAILSECGYIPVKDLNTLRKYDSYLEGHPSNKIPGVDVSSGSLGQGLSIANGMALSKKISNENGYVFCLVGDGELEEGQIWEALMTSNKYDLNNLILIVDNNGLQIDGTNEQVKKLDMLEEKISSFGFDVQSVNGHDISNLMNAIDVAKSSQNPNCIIAKTIKGKGVSFMENEVSWHGRALKQDEYERAIEELGGNV